MGEGGARLTRIGTPATRRPRRPLPTRADHLDYIAEMLRELKAMSERVDRPALTVLLELAYQEAAHGRRPG